MDYFDLFVKPGMPPDPFLLFSFQKQKKLGRKLVLNKEAVNVVNILIDSPV